MGQPRCCTICGTPAAPSPTCSTTFTSARCQQLRFCRWPFECISSRMYFCRAWLDTSGLGQYTCPNEEPEEGSGGAHRRLATWQMCLHPCFAAPHSDLGAKVSGCRRCSGGQQFSAPLRKQDRVQSAEILCKCNQTKAQHDSSDQHVG